CLLAACSAVRRVSDSFPTRRSSDLVGGAVLMAMPIRVAFAGSRGTGKTTLAEYLVKHHGFARMSLAAPIKRIIAECPADPYVRRSEEHTSELQSRENLVCRLLLEKK